MSNTLSQETIVYSVDFVSWSISNIPLGFSAPILLNKWTCRACGQPHKIRKGLVLRIDLMSNLDLVSQGTPNGVLMIVLSLLK
jgi:hypothetical protein